MKTLPYLTIHDKNTDGHLLANHLTTRRPQWCRHWSHPKLICYNLSMNKPVKTADAIVSNKRAFFDYALGETLVCGIVLTGPEVRAVRDGRAQLKGSYVTIRNNELWLNNTSFSVKSNNPKEEGQVVVSTEPKKLLATHKQIINFANEKTAGYTIVPTRMFTNNRHIKVEIALAKGKKEYDKRQVIKQRDTERENLRFLGKR